jgi:RNA polymerase sigma factor (sigma-70 family)
MSQEQFSEQYELTDEAFLIDHNREDDAPERLRNVSVSEDPVKDYLKAIGQYPLLKAEEEVELSKRIEAGLMANHKLAGPMRGPNYERRKEELEWLANDGARAKEDFYNSNLRLVVSIAKKYIRPGGMPFLDIIQEGNVGLMRAVEKFDYTKGYKFSTYASWWVRQQITRGIANQARIVRLPVHVVEDLNQVSAVRRNLLRELKYEPHPHEIAEELGFDTEKVVDLLRWGRDHISLDTPVDEDGGTSVGDLIAHDTVLGPDEVVLDQDARDRLHGMLVWLKDTEEYVIKARYGLIDGSQHKLADIGLKIGLSAERIRQIEREALEKLRRRGEDDGLAPVNSTVEALPATVEQYVPRHARFSAIPMLARNAIETLISNPHFGPESTGLSEKQMTAIMAYGEQGSKKAVIDAGIKTNEVNALVSSAVATLLELMSRPAEQH